MIDALEQLCDDFNADLPELRSFVLPGGTEASARLHVARTICRRAERDVLLGAQEVELNPLVLRYLNRLSDLLFILARAANAAAGATSRCGSLGARASLRRLVRRRVRRLDAGARARDAAAAADRRADRQPAGCRRDEHRDLGRVGRRGGDPPRAGAPRRLARRRLDGAAVDRGSDPRRARRRRRLGAAALRRDRRRARLERDRSRRSGRCAPHARERLRLWPAVASGLGIGALGGAVGVILGTLRMPTLVRGVGMDVRRAAGTNLVVGFLLGVAGFAAHAGEGGVDWPILLAGLAGAIPGGWLGARATGRIDETCCGWRSARCSWSSASRSRRRPRSSGRRWPRSPSRAAGRSRCAGARARRAGTDRERARRGLARDRDQRARAGRRCAGRRRSGARTRPTSTTTTRDVACGVEAVERERLIGVAVASDARAGMPACPAGAQPSPASSPASTTSISLALRLRPARAWGRRASA